MRSCRRRRRRLGVHRHRRAPRLLRALRGRRLRRGARGRPSTRWATTASWRPRSTPPTPSSVEALVREHRVTHVMNAVDPVFDMPIFDGAFAGGRRLPRHGDEPVEAAPRDAVRGVRRQARRRAVREGRATGRRAGRLALVGIGVEPGPLRRVRALRRRPPVLRDRRARHPRRRQPRGDRRRRQRDLRAVVLDVDHDRGVPQPAGDLGEGPWLVHHRRRSASRRSSTSPRASARSSASTWSTRRCC